MFGLKRCCEISHLTPECWGVKLICVCCSCHVARHHTQALQVYHAICFLFSILQSFD